MPFIDKTKTALLSLLLAASSVMAQDEIAMASATRPDIADPVGGGGVVINVVVVPAGEFLMGSPEAESGRSTREGPQKKVALKQDFGLSRTEITVAQFREFVDDTGYTTDAEKAGESTVFDLAHSKLVTQSGVTWKHDYKGDRAEDDAPVLHVSWQDAMAFVDWLSKRTGASYRLPTEAEFEYALRAGSTSRYWWGDGSPEKRVENLTGARDRVGQSKMRWPVGFRNYTDRHWGPAPAGSFEENPFGLKDMGGNTSEWVQDCYSDSLEETPADGSPNSSGDCSMRLLRGASWANPPPMARSAYRNAAKVTTTSALLGFRVARDL